LNEVVYIYTVHLSVFRLTKNGFVGSKNFPDFQKTGPTGFIMGWAMGAN